MNSKEIDNLSAGPELDNLIAEKVMGWRFRAATPDAEWVAYHEDWWIAPKSEGTPPRDMFKSPHPFSTDIAAAWKVVEVMNELRFDTEDNSHVNGHSDGGAWFAVEKSWHSQIKDRVWFAGLRNSYDYEGEGWACHVIANTAPLAICRAALRVIAIHRGEAR